MANSRHKSEAQTATWATTQTGIMARVFVLVVAALLVAGFFAYFTVTSTHLPIQAGPDYDSHDDVTRFIVKYDRLAILPDDEAELYFSVYGGTRALRPPLTYLLSAFLADRDIESYRHQRLTYRRAGVWLGALTVGAVFLSVFFFFGNLWLALLGGLLMGLLPQFSFIASYNNDDIGAIFSGAMLTLALVLLEKRGHSLSNAIFLGFAGGLVILSKPSAWLLLPALLLILLWHFVRRRKLQVIRTIIVSAVVGAITGGWWLAFNAHHYGVNDIFLFGITQETAQKFTRLPTDHSYGYHAKGLTAADLLLRNADAFLDKTYQSTVGNLDWLRLQLGKIQYGWYGLIFFLAAIAAPLCSITTLRQTRAPPSPEGTVTDHSVVFLWSLSITTVVLFAAYVSTNLYNDIQTQGKYLLPVFPAVIILALSGLTVIGTAIGNWIVGTTTDRIALTRLGTGAVLLLSLVTLGVHRDGLVNYVLPFYKPSFYDVPPQPFRLGTFVPITLQDIKIGKTHDVESVDKQNATLVINSTGTDPYVVLDADVCQDIRGNGLVRIKIEATQKDTLSIYWDDGNGFGARKHNGARYGAGTSELHIWLGPQRCKRLRIDPGTKPGTVIVHAMAVAPVDMGRR